MGPKTIEILIKGGWGSLEKLSQAKPDDLTVLRGVGEKTATKIIEAARSVLEKGAAGVDAPEAVSAGAEEPAEGETPPTDDGAQANAETAVAAEAPAEDKQPEGQ